MREGDSPLSLTPPCSPWGVSISGGFNSTALILALADRGFVPDWVAFADTGCELPSTYKAIADLEEWMAKNTTFPPVVTLQWVRTRGELADGQFYPLDVVCNMRQQLPGKAYGKPTCTRLYKIYPIDRWRKKNGYDEGAVAIGYDAGEKQRVQKACNRQPDSASVRSSFWYPLVAWGIDRQGCIDLCQKHGLMVHKSSCYFCPSKSKRDWDWLRHYYPDLFNKAIDMDRNADPDRRGRGGFGLFRGWYRYGNNEPPAKVHGPSCHNLPPEAYLEPEGRGPLCDTGQCGL